MQIIFPDIFRTLYQFFRRMRITRELYFNSCLYRRFSAGCFDRCFFNLCRLGSSLLLCCFLCSRFSARLLLCRLCLRRFFYFLNLFFGICSRNCCRLCCRLLGCRFLYFCHEYSPPMYTFILLLCSNHLVQYLIIY